MRGQPADDVQGSGPEGRTADPTSVTNAGEMEDTAMGDRRGTGRRSSALAPGSSLGWGLLCVLGLWDRVTMQGRTPQVMPRLSHLCARCVVCDFILAKSVSSFEKGPFFPLFTVLM